MIDQEFESEEVQNKIKELRDKIKNNSKSQKIKFEKNWFRSILFYIGNQWITFYQSSMSWERPRELPAWYPTPVTNKFARAINTIRAILIQKEPRALVTPATNSDDDIATADVGDKLIDVIDRETNISVFRKIASAWYVITGNVFCHTYAYQNKENGEIFIPYEQCMQCAEIVSPKDITDNGNKCPHCQGTKFILAKNADGQPAGDTQPKTKIVRDACSPFEIHCEQQIQDINKIKNFVRTKTLPLDDVKKMYPDFEDKIVGDSSGGDVGQDYLNTLAFSVTSGDSNTILGGSTGGGKAERATLDYLYQLPNDDFPNGVVATINAGTVLECMAINDIYVDVYGKAFLPLAFAGYMFVPGRLWHKSVSDDIIEKQKQRNKLESFIELITFRMGAPDWLKPSVCGDINIGGEPGQEIEYTEGPRGEKPSKVPGSDIPASINQRIEQIDKDFEDLAATYDALKGQSPTNINTFSGLKLLTERGYSSHMELIKNWEKFNEDIATHGLDIARNTMVEERKKTFKNELGDWETETFTKADIQGGVDIKIEAGSSVPRSQAAEQGSLVDSIKLGLVDTSDPGTHYKVLEKLGQAEFKNEIDIDVKDAKKEWKDFLGSVTQFPNDPRKWVTRPRKGIDNEKIHLKDAMMRAKTDEFFRLPQQAQQMWIEHAMAHEANVNDEMMRQAMMQGGVPQGPGMQAPPNKSASALNINKPEFSAV